MSLTRARFCRADSRRSSARRFLGLEAGDAGGFFDDGAAVLRLGGEELADALLADDGVGLAAEAGAHEDVLDVAEAADFAVEEVFGVAGAEEAAGDGELAGADGGAAELAAADLEDDAGRLPGCARRGWVAVGGSLGSSPSRMVPGWASATASSVSWRAARGVRLVPVGDSWRSRWRCRWRRGVVVAVVDLGVDKGERDLGHAGGFAVAGAGEDDVFHLEAAQALGGLLAEHPGDGVGDVGLAAAVGPDDGGDALAGELDLGAVAEGLEAEDLELS